MTEDKKNKWSTTGTALMWTGCGIMAMIVGAIILIVVIALIFA